MNSTPDLSADKGVGLPGRTPIATALFRLRGLLSVAAILALAAGCADQRTAPVPDALRAPVPITTPQTLAQIPVVTPEPIAPTIEARPQEPVDAQPIPPVVEPVPPVAMPAEPAPAVRPLIEGPPVKVAILLPLSGANAALGQALLRAAQLALFEVGDSRFVLLPRDTEGQPKGAAAAAENALAEGAELILGPIFSAEVQAAAQVTRSRKIPMVAFSTDRAAAGNGVYLMGFMPEQQVTRVMSYAVDKGIRRFAALLPDSPYGMSLSAAMRRGARDLNVAFDRQESYSGAIAEAGEPIRRLKGESLTSPTGFDALLIGEGGERLRAIGALLPANNIDPHVVRLLGTGLWDDPGIGSEPALVGAWFAGATPGEFDALRSRYRRHYGSTDVLPRIGTLAYDATALAAVLARTETRANYSEATLTNPSGFAGVDGIFRFGPDGVVERGLTVIEVERDGLRVISPSPVSFEDLTN